MGLDMYLNSKKYIQKWDHRPDATSDAIEALNVPGMGSMKPAYLECQAIYWRKANAIHRFFVERVQGGNDDCGHYYVPREVLVNLLAAAKAVLADPKLGPNALPTQAGFFFGDTNYDDWYLYDMRYTAVELEKLIASDLWKDGWEFYYHSSW